MIKTILITSIAAAASVASAVSLLPPREVMARPLATRCGLQAWPYYENSCVRDQREGHARQIRIVSVDRLPTAKSMKLEK